MCLDHLKHFLECEYSSTNVSVSRYRVATDDSDLFESLSFHFEFEVNAQHKHYLLAPNAQLSLIEVVVEKRKAESVSFGACVS